MGKMGLDLKSRALLSKTLIQLFADEWHCIPSLVVIRPKANLRPDSLEIPEMGTWVLISGAELHEQNMQTLTVACKWIGFILKEKKYKALSTDTQSVQFSCSVMSNSLQPHRMQHVGLPCPSPTLGACSNSCPLSQWCHPNISSSAVPFSSCPQCFPASGSFPRNQFFTSGGQSVGVSASASVLPMNIHEWFALGLTVAWSPCIDSINTERG